jgi:hypothetical protein
VELLKKKILPANKTVSIMQEHCMIARHPKKKAKNVPATSQTRYQPGNNGIQCCCSRTAWGLYCYGEISAAF